MTLKDYYESFIQVKGAKSLTKEYYLNALEYYQASEEELINPEEIMGAILFKRRDKLERFAKCYKFTVEELEEIIKVYLSKYASPKELVIFLAGDNDIMDFLHQFIQELDSEDVGQKYGLTEEQIIGILQYYSSKEASIILKDEEKSKTIWQDIKMMREKSIISSLDVFSLYAKEHYLSISLVKAAYYLHESVSKKEQKVR